MDVERIIDEIEQLQEMFEAPDTRPIEREMTSRLRIAGTMTSSRIVLGSACGSILAFAAARERVTEHTKRVR
jgi:hypothetical protein